MAQWVLKKLHRRLYWSGLGIGRYPRFSIFTANSRPIVLGAPSFPHLLASHMNTNINLLLASVQNRTITWSTCSVYSISNTQTANSIILVRSCSYFSSSSLVMPHCISFLLPSMESYQTLHSIFPNEYPSCLPFPFHQYYRDQPTTRGFFYIINLYTYPNNTFNILTYIQDYYFQISTFIFRPLRVAH